MTRPAPPEGFLLDQEPLGSTMPEPPPGFVVQGQEPALRRSFDKASETTPDRHAQVLKLAEQSKLPPEIVENNFDEIKKRSDVLNEDYGRIRRETPKLAEWLKDANNAKVARDDLDQLGHIETLLNLVKSGTAGALQGIGGGIAGVGDILDAASRMYARTMRTLGLPAPDEYHSYWLLPVPDLLRSIGRTTAYAAGAPILETPKTIPNEIAGGLGQLAPILATAILQPELAEPLIGALFAGQGAEGLQQQAEQLGKAGTTSADVGLLSVGALNAVAGEVGLSKLLDRLPPKIKTFALQKLADVAISGGYQALLQSGLTLASNIGTKLALDPTHPLTGDLLEQAVVGGAVGAISRGVLGVALPSLGGKLERMAAARQNKAVLEALSQGVTDSKTFQRLPEKLQEFVKNATKDGPIENVYIPSDEAAQYFQDKNLDPEDILGPAGAARYRQALQTGEDVQIPIEEYAARIAPSEHAKAFNDIVRMGSPEAMNLRESEEFSKSVQAPEPQEEQTADTSAQRVGEDIRGQLLGQGFEPKTVDAYAQLYESAFRAMGERSGQDPFALYEQYRLKITRPLPEILRTLPNIDTQLDPLIDRLRAGKTPTQEEMFGKSLVDFLRESGGLKDEGGELASREPDAQRKPFQKRLLNKKGLPLDTAREMAAEAGYIDKQSSIADFLNLIDKELRGEPIRAIGQEQPEAIEQNIILEQLDQYLKQRGVDIKTASNEEIKKVLNQAAQVPAIDAATGTLLGQSLLPRRVERYLSDQDLEKQRADTASTLLSVFDQLPPDADFEAAALGGQIKKGWYEQSARALSDVFGPDAPRFTGLLAALSPQTSVEQNLYNALRVWNAWNEAGRPTTEKQILKVFSKTLGKETLKMTSWTNNAVRMLTADDPISTVLSGPKVNSFYENLRGSTNAVTLDTWMAKFAGTDQDMFGGNLNIAGTDPGRGPRYLAISAKIRRVAESLTKKTGDTWTPAEVQETIWSWVKTLDEFAGKSGLTAEQIIKEGRLSDAMIAGTPDFAKLFIQDPTARQLLEEAGYGQVLNQIENSLRTSQGTGASRQEFGQASREKSPGLVRSARRLDRLREGEVTRYAQQLGLDKRGTIHFGPDRQFSIELLKDADLSTFLHETGHFYLEVFGDIVDELRTRPGERSELESRMVSDYDEALKWLGVESREKIGQPQHEQFARGFEAYLREGKAPSPELRTIFQRFKAWLMNIYRSVTQLNVSLSPEVRGVFDRLLASDEEIQRARQEADIREMIESQGQAERLGLSPEEYRVYGKAVQEARDKAQETLDREYLDEFNRTSTDWYQARRNEVRAEVANEVHSQKDYMVLSFLTDGKLPDGSPLPEGVEPFKLDAEALEERYGKHKDSAIMQQLRKLDIYRREGGVDPDAAAEQFGYSSGDELVQAMLNARPMESLIDAETDDRMKHTYGDILTDGTAPEKARDAVMTEGRTKVIQAEMKALAKTLRETEPIRKLGERQAKQAERQARAQGMAKIQRFVPSIQLARDIANDRIASLRVRDVNPSVYYATARKESAAANLSVNSGDFDAALTHKQRELINVEMYRAATDTVKEVEKIRDRMRSFDDPKKRGRIGKAGEEYLDQIDKLRERFEFSRQTNKALDKRASLQEFIDSERAKGHELDIPLDVLNEARRQNYRDMTVQELRGLNDAVRTIEHWAQFKNKLLRQQEKRELDVLGAEGTASIDGNSRGPRKQTMEMRLPGSDKGRKIESFFLAHLPLGSILREMDGFKDGGFLFENVMRPIDDAGNAEAVRLEQATKAVTDIYNSAFKGEETELWQKQSIPEINDSLTKWGRLMVALNWGNEGNRQRVRSGFGWNDGQVQAILNTLDERDWKFVQNVWDHINSYWGEISDKQQRVTGVRPDKVEASPVQTKFGEMKGGYFPISYESRLSARAAANPEASFAKLIEASSYTKATTARGHTEARLKNVSMPLRLDPGVITEHLQQVIHDLTHHEMLIDVGRILGRKDIQESIYRNYGDIAYKEIKSHVRDIALGSTPSPDWYRTYAAIRSNAVTARLGWNAVTALIHVPNITSGMVRVGPKWVAKGVIDSLSSAKNAEYSAQWIAEQSDMMRLRWKHRMVELSEFRDQIGLNRGKLSSEIHDAVQKLGIDPEVASHFKDSYLYAIHRILQFAEIPTWVGAYEKAIAAGREPNDALAQADRAILDSIGGGQMKDVASIQKGAIGKIFTTFMTYQLSMHRLGREILLKDEGALRKMVDATLLSIIPVAFVTAIHHFARPPKKEEGFAHALLNEGFDHAVGMFAGVRELAGAFQKPDYQGPASFGVFGALRQATFRIGKGEVKPATVKAINEAAGELFGYPAAQVTKTIEGAISLWEGKSRNPDVLLFGPAKR